MFLYRVSNLAAGKTRDTIIPSLAAELGKTRGQVFHALLSKKYEGMGRNLELPRIVFLTDSKEDFAPIKDMITCHPDMDGTTNATLYVEEWKTITPKAGADTKGRIKKEGVNQVFLYAYVCNLNLIQKRDHIVLSIKIWINNDTIENMTNRKHDATGKETFKGREIKDRVESYLEAMFQKKGIIVPAYGVILAPNPSYRARKDYKKSVCKECATSLTKKKKYKVSNFYLCHMCFYTSATHAEYQEHAEKIISYLKDKDGRTN